jgi:hypothetical protein
MEAGQMLRGARWALALGAVVGAALAAPAGAATLRRAGLEELVQVNQQVVVGEVLDVHSYWNADNTFILSDVRIEVAEVLKGQAGPVMTITVMGGTVGDLTTLIVGGPELVPGRSYVLFVGPGDLPGAAGVPTLRDLTQAVFDVRLEAGGVRARSQAAGLPLVPDAFGATEPAGGRQGVELDSLVRSIRELAGSGEKREELR